MFIVRFLIRIVMFLIHILSVIIRLLRIAIEHIIVISIFIFFPTHIIIRIMVLIYRPLCPRPFLYVLVHVPFFCSLFFVTCFLILFAFPAF